ncbi:serine/threonine-protein kinase [Actinomadura parmotrematis]|uniref:non-specific serine/threonine protein kinase n=1 Tax=Actinomadura parmotrematis TaxID=2864039 RepID=A0ABS7G1A3_9ACTN|nr:serine/threonine-protein kinase [Actinomadura parmotrematis]MBW8485649.1 serine/threonine protein kinase [Actinomadura parmotrematis]
MSAGMVLAGRYRLEALVGRGGMGQVWRARDEQLARPVAVKVMAVPPALDEAERARLEARFRREAQVAARLQHPGIAVVHDFGRQAPGDGGGLYLVMELLPGRDLARVLTDHPAGLPWRRAAAIGAQVADALDAAHAERVVHRDVKPSNVVVDDRDRAKLVDFGIAGYADALTRLTGDHMLGTPAYMAPEQFDSADVDARADLYSLGVLLYTVLAGVRPFDAGSLHRLVKAVLMDEARPLREHRPDVPAGLERLVAELMAKAPADRPDGAAGVARRLTGLLADPGALTRPDHARTDQSAALRETRERMATAARRLLDERRRAAGQRAAERRAADTVTAKIVTPRTATVKTVERPDGKAAAESGFFDRPGNWALALAGIAAAAVVLNPGGKVIDRGDFAAVPACAQFRSAGLAGATPTGSAGSCSWTYTSASESWSVSLMAERHDRSLWRSGPKMARARLDAVRKAAAAQAPASLTGLGDQAFYTDSAAGRLNVDFRVSNLDVFMYFTRTRPSGLAARWLWGRGIADDVAAGLQGRALTPG